MVSDERGDCRQADDLAIVDLEGNGLAKRRYVVSDCVRPYQEVIDVVVQVATLVVALACVEFRALRKVIELIQEFSPGLMDLAGTGWTVITEDAWKAAHQ